MDKKFSKIEDPQNCSIEELSKEVSRLKDLTEYYEGKQLALKIFLNSIYGACASPYFIGHNTDVAESITLQGQDLNHYSENRINEYFSGVFQKDKELHDKLGIDHEKASKVDIGGGRESMPKPCTGPEFSYLDNPKTLTVMGDTDSVSGDSQIYFDNTKTSIETVWDCVAASNTGHYIKKSNGSEIIDISHSGITTPAYNTKLGGIENSPINYIMRHKVSKAQYVIKSKDGKSVRVTEDHSCMVFRDGRVIEVKAADINPKTDKLLVLKN